ncbi:hypothetical protein COCSUDRAFT_40921 [Coccomyxa subellipsoidea C-169]|uniref:CRAL-TRIO domain-containing protein n=1 Tax=Coccomyxa subellipsoidea (strain C-169) TaxID=574566 RepID=I0Z1N7_COCSC|nr:hypothetical protein COCSUDRAFT_40921 [Coccomyxa subellipsoidea C-169]EIE24556.1 hypothetical protein COCSUDRAFT_40921 [Coccomyxa subellipsoidea C-169]|eukprot:XP_005649100.1 hypothetical protein COCSUDRAFT_40921 [Coccomyxa subellipsoidea C-169]
MHASLIGPAIFAIQQLLFQRALQPSREAVSPTLRAKDVAVAHSDVVADIRRKLEERGVSLPASHFADVDVELARYAITVGLLSAQTAADSDNHYRAKVVEAAAARAQATAEWLLSHSFMPEEQLGKWASVVHWSDDDADGHPVLVVHLEAALQQDAAGAASAAEAILSHMEAALRRHFDNNPSSPEQLVVVLDSRGASTLQFRRLVRTIQSIAVTLNRHYPARLHRLYLVNAPVIVHLPVRAIKALLHPSTSSKIIICDLEDPRLPVDLDYDSASSIHQTAEAAPP